MQNKELIFAVVIALLYLGKIKCGKISHSLLLVIYIRLSLILKKIVPDFNSRQPISDFFDMLLATSRTLCIICHKCKGRFSPCVLRQENSPSVTVPKSKTVI